MYFFGPSLTHTYLLVFIFTEFLSWKKTEENETKSSFVQDTSAKTLKDNSKAYYFYCHRSFSERSHSKTVSTNVDNEDDDIDDPTQNQKTTKIKQKQKSAGSNKTGFSCPAQMKAIVSGQRVKVDYCSTHMGHECELGRMPLREEERVMIAGKSYLMNFSL